MNGRFHFLRVWWLGLLDPAQAARLVLEPHPSQRLFRPLLIGIAILYALYGFTMGLFRGWWPAAVSSAKLSFLYLCTLLICVPALYVLNCTLGPRLKFVQCLKVLILALSVNAVALGSYILFSLFFTVTISREGYQPLVLMHVGVFGVAGLISMLEIGLIMRAVAARMGEPLGLTFLAGWTAIYAFVGTEVSWVLRPWIGSWSTPYTPFRPISGSFIESVYHLLF